MRQDNPQCECWGRLQTALTLPEGQSIDIALATLNCTACSACSDRHVCADIACDVISRVNDTRRGVLG
jgi:hypothetical protein